ICEPPESTVFTGDNEGAEVKFSASKRSPGYLRFLLLARIRRGALDGPNPWCRRALLSMTKRSMAVQFFCHSFAVPVSSAVLRIKTERAHEQQYEFVPCIRLRSWLKNKN